jgi:hypothetical protein
MDTFTLLMVSQRTKPTLERTGDVFELQVGSGLTKTEAEDLLDYLEAAGYGPSELSFVNGEGFRIRISFGTNRTA